MEHALEGLLRDRLHREAVIRRLRAVGRLAEYVADLEYWGQGRGLPRVSYVPVQRGSGASDRSSRIDCPALGRLSELDARERSF